MTNNNYLDLLPPERKRAFTRAYVVRLVTLTAWAGVVLAVVASVLLIPTYTYLLSAESTAKAHLAAAEANISTAEESDLGKRLTALEGDAGIIVGLATSTPASLLVKEVLAVPRAGVVLSNFEYTPAAGGHPGTLALSGTAATRNDLRAFQLALTGSPAFTNADLPVSSYAKDADLPFMITVTLATSTVPSGTPTSP